MIYIALYNSPKYWWWVEQVVSNLLKNFSISILSQVILICNDINEDNIFHYNWIKCINVKTKRFQLLDKFFLLSRLIYAYKLYWFTKDNLKKTDILNIHWVEYCFFISLFHKKLQDFKLIISTHGSYYLWYTDYIIKGLPHKFFLLKFFFIFWRYYFYLIEKIASSRWDYFIHVNGWLKKYYEEKHNIDKNISSILYNWIDTSKRKKRHKKSLRNFTALIIGSTYYWKWLDVAEKVLDKLVKEGHDIKLLVVWFSWYKNKFKFIDYLGRISPDDVLKVIDSSDFLLFPTRSEGFPVVILEALQSWIPIVTSVQSHYSEIPNHKDMWFIASTWIVEDYVNMCKQLMNLNKYNQFTENIFLHDFWKFDWKYITAHYEKIFLN